MIAPAAFGRASPISWRALLRLAALAVVVGLVATIVGAGLSPASAKAARAARKDGGEAFQAFVGSLWPLAEARGVSKPTFERAFAGVAFDAKIVAHTKAQAEFVRPIWQYVASAASPARIARGAGKAEAEEEWLARAKSEYGVEQSTVIGIWGLETDFGGFAGSDNVVRALASLAFVHFRGDYFRDELISALVILEEGDIDAREMRGSWAGAMGQTQFMPSSFLDFAVDFDGDGRRDIWKSAPDAIGSTANYLAKHGWTPGLPWGFEVRLPRDFALTAADSARAAAFSAFAERGVTRPDGKQLPASGEGRLLLPAGLRGPVFLVTGNFDVIKSYNNSTAYALGVSLLGDAAMGGGGVVAAWPTRDKPLSESQTKDLQASLRKLGYNPGDIDGRMGETVRAAVRAYQEDHGLAPDGYANVALLKRLHARP